MRIVTYNILAQAYVKPEFYPRTPTAALDPARRRQALIARIAGLSADVLCLQEVEEDAYQAIGAHLAGYQGRYARKQSGKPDGCATFWRKATLLSERTVWYGDGTGHLALLVELEHGGQRLGIANTHLKWEAPAARAASGLAVRQASALLAAMDAGAAWVACGDFNAAADSEAIRMVIAAGWRDPYTDRDTFTCNPNGRAQRIDYLLHTAAITVRPGDAVAIDATTPLPSESEPSDHLPVAGEVLWQPSV